jgi:hypothetical protein
MFASLTEPLAATRQLLIDGLIASLVLAMVVAVVSETLRSGLQRNTRERMFRDWWFSLNEASQDIERALREAVLPANLNNEASLRDFCDNALQASQLPNELFMRKVENMGRGVLERPSERPLLFAVLTAGTARDDQWRVIQFDASERSRDFAAAQPAASVPGDGDGSSDEETISHGIVAAQDRISSAFDRNLDDLQLRFAREWPLMMFTLSLLVGLALSLLIAFLVNGFGSLGYVVAMGMIGAAAGLIAAVGRDGISRLLDARRSLS